MDANEANILLPRAQSETKEVNEIDAPSKELLVATTTVTTKDIPAQHLVINVNKDTDLSVNKETVQNASPATELMNVDTKLKNQEQIQNLDQASSSVKINDNATPVVVNICTSVVTLEPVQQPSKEVISAGLTMLSQYDSDASENDLETGDDLAKTSANNESDVESVVEIFSNINDYRSEVVELSSDSDDDSSSSDSSACNALEGEKKSTRSLKHLRKVIDKSIAAVGSDDDDEDDEVDENGVSKLKRRVPPKVKGEMLLEDLPPIEDLHITVPEEECIELGRVHSIVDQLLLVTVLPNSLLLDLDTVLFLDKGKRVLGAVFDVLGPVAAPLYCVRFNSNTQIQEKQINVGDVVYVAPKTEYTQFVILSSLMKLRGSDASWENDVEPPQRFLDYSDDEQERQARARLRNKDRQEPAENDIRHKRSNNNNNGDNDDDASDAMSVMSDSTVVSEQSNRGHWRAGRTRSGRARGVRGRGMHAFNTHSPAPQMQGFMPNYAQNYDNSSWHSNLYPPQPYAFPAHPPAAGMGYYQYIPPPYAYGPNNMPYPPHVQQMQALRQPMPPQPPHQ